MNKTKIFFYYMLIKMINLTTRAKRGGGFGGGGSARFVRLCARGAFYCRFELTDTICACCFCLLRVYIYAIFFITHSLAHNACYSRPVLENTKIYTYVTYIYISCTVAGCPHVPFFCDGLECFCCKHIRERKRIPHSCHVGVSVLREQCTFACFTAYTRRTHRAQF